MNTLRLIFIGMMLFLVAMADVSAKDPASFAESDWLVKSCCIGILGILCYFISIFWLPTIWTWLKRNW
jgi:hypothetical protein